MHTQWLDLLHLFSTLVDTTALHSQHDGLKSLQQATEKFQEVTQSIHDDPRLLSLLGKRRGQKGFREMQGEQLRQCLSDILSTLVCLCMRVRERVVMLHAWQDAGCMIVHLSFTPVLPSLPSLPLPPLPLSPLSYYKGECCEVGTMSVGGGMLPVSSVELPH